MQEADAKCNDLLDHITFMLSSVSVLRHVNVMDATRRVINCMNNVLKDAASERLLGSGSLPRLPLLKLHLPGSVRSILSSGAHHEGSLPF